MEVDDEKKCIRPIARVLEYARLGRTREIPSVSVGSRRTEAREYGWAGQVGYGYMNPDQYSTEDTSPIYGKAGPYDDNAKKQNLTVGVSGRRTEAREYARVLLDFLVEIERNVIRRSGVPTHELVTVLSGNREIRCII